MKNENISNQPKRMKKKHEKIFGKNFCGKANKKKALDKQKNRRNKNIQQIYFHEYLNFDCECKCKRKPIFMDCPILMMKITAKWNKYTYT